MKKRILSILLSIVMLAGLLPTTALAADADGLYIGGVALPSGSYYKNGGTVSDTEPSDWNARYVDNTLTIRNLLVEGQASSDTQESAGIYYDDYDGSTPLTLVIEGANSVTGGDNSSASGAYASHGIYSGDALTIEGDGALSVSGGTVAYAASSFGIYAQNNLMVNGGVINATGGTASGTGSSYGIGLYNSGACGMTVKGGTLNATGGTASSGSSAGIYAAFASQFVNIQGGILVATGGAGTNSYGIYNSQSSRENNTVNANGGILVARAGGETDKSKAIEGKLTMTGAKIAGGTAESAAVAIVPDSYTVQNEALINDGNAPDYTIDTDTAVVVTQGTPLGLITAGSNVTLNGDLVLINLQNKVQTPALYLGTDATVSGSGTLTAIGAPDQENSYGISGMGQDFSVRGAKVIAIGSTASNNSYGIGAEVYVDVSENGSVIAIGGAAGNTDGCKSRGISGAVAADSGTINAIGGTAAASCGVFSDPAYSNSTVTVTSGTLNAVGGVSDDPSCGVSAPSVTVADAGMIHAVGRTYGLSAQNGPLTGGSFTGGTAAVKQKTYGGSVSDLLAEGCGFYAGDSQLDGSSQTVGGSYQTVTVKQTVTEAQWGASADVLDNSGTLAKAFDAKPAYIRLQSSVTLAAGITVTDGTTTLDLNGQTITGAAGTDRLSRGVTPITVEYGALTLIDTAGGGGIVGGNGGEDAGNALKVDGGTLNIGDSVSSGSFTLTGGDTSSSSGSSGKGLYIASGGEVVVKQAFSLRGGIKANSYDFALQSFGTLTGGSYPITATGGITIYGGTATGLNATVTEASDALHISNVTEVSITGGSYTGTRYGLWVTNSTSAGAVTISGGTFITTDLDANSRVAIKNSGPDSYAGLLAEGCFYTDDAANDTPIENEGTLAAAKKLVVKTSAPAAAHSHDISVDCGSDSPVEFIEWKPGDFNGGFPSDPGSYVLADNVNIDSSETWVIGSGINLCLNGHTLTMEGSGDILLNSEDSTLNICDCSAEGTGCIKNVSSYKSLEGIEINDSKAKFNLYGGNIYIESTYTGSDGYAYGVDGGSAYINIYGGTITAKASNNKAVALNISSNTPHFKIYGGVLTAVAPEGKDAYGLYLPSLYSGWNSYDHYSISGGVFIGRNSIGIGSGTDLIEVTGGIFSTDPTGVIDPSYTARVIRDTDPGYKDEYDGYCVVEPAAVHTHSYTYTANGATITESCGCGHSATATISVPQPSYPHTGAAITPATVSYGGTSTWAGGDLTPAYENNTNVGEATAKIAIGGATASVTFTITAADPDTHTVTFNMNGHGTAIDPVTASSGEKVTKPTDPTATGYTFDGWFKEQACTNEWDFDNDTVNGNTTLYAKWTAETYSVMLNANGGAISSGNVTSYTYGVGATLPTADDMAKDGHRFGGWYESADLSGSPVTVIPAAATGDKVYYAKWIEQHSVSGTITGKDGIQYSNVSARLIALGGDAEEIENIDKTSEENVTPEVYTFSNVTVDAGQYNLVVTATGTTNNDKEVAVTALVDLTTTDKEVELTLPDSAKSSTVKTSADETPEVIAGGVDQIAEETAIPDGASSITIKLTVDEKRDAEVADDAEKIAAVAGGQTIDLYLDIQLQLFKDEETTGTDLGNTNTQILKLLVPADTSKTGLTVYRVHDGKAEALKKDSADANGEYFTLGDGFVTIYAKKFSVYALGYTPDDTYTITLDANGGTVNGGGTATLVTGADKKLSSLPTPTRSGSYTFDGWFTEASGGAEVTTDTVFISDQTIYAHWTYTGSTGGGGGYTPTYSITVEKAENGKVEANRSSASSGSTVTLTVTPEDGYVLDRLTVTDSQGNNIEAADKGNGTYTFKMPSRKVTVEAVFVPDGSFSTCTGGSACPIYPYTDADPAAWYHDGVHYCIDSGLMAGYGNNIFKPDADTTRGMLAVMLWRLNGSPVVNYALDFEDVAEGQWYTEAIRWAVSEGIAIGYGNGYFGTNDAITREQLAAMLWRYAGSPESSRSLDHFGDAMEVSGYAVEALAWANEQGIVVGVGNNTLSPQSHATRAQVATMLMRMVQATTK